MNEIVKILERRSFGDPVRNGLRLMESEFEQAAKEISQLNKDDEQHKQLIEIDKKLFYWELWASKKNKQLIQCLKDLRDLCPKFSQPPKTKEGEG